MEKHPLMNLTHEQLEAARERLEPYFNGYPSPMMDTRRLRVANGAASGTDIIEVYAEDVVIREYKELNPDWKESHA